MKKTVLTVTAVVFLAGTRGALGGDIVELIPSITPLPTSSFYGRSVAIDGNVVVVGSPGQDRIFSFDISNISIPVETLTIQGASAAEEFGVSVGVLNNKIAVGSVWNGEWIVGYPRVSFYNANTGVWLGEIVDTADALSDLGFSLSMHGDKVIAGAAGAYVGIDRTGEAWYLDAVNYSVDSIFQPPSGYPDYQDQDRFGHAVSLSATHSAIGAPVTDEPNRAGSVKILGNNSYTLVGPLSVSDDKFGWSVAVSDTNSNLVLIGAPGRDVVGGVTTWNKGLVYVYELDTGSLLFTLEADDGQSHDEFGSSVAISGDFALIGAPGDDGDWSNSALGAVYMFNLNSGHQMAKRILDLDTNVSRFGTSVAASGTNVVVGASANSQHAYVFEIPCNQADLDEPYGVLHHGDLSAFTNAYIATDSLADLNGDGFFNFTDLSIFMNAYSAGCP